MIKSIISGIAMLIKSTYAYQVVSSFTGFDFTHYTSFYEKEVYKKHEAQISQKLRNN